MILISMMEKKDRSSFHLRCVLQFLGDGLFVKKYENYDYSHFVEIKDSF